MKISAVVFTFVFLLSAFCINAQESIIPGFLLQGVYGINGGAVRVHDVTACPDGSTYTVGSFSNTVDFYPGPDTFNLDNGGEFVAKYNAQNQPEWAFKFDYATISSVTADKFDNLYMCGSFSYKQDFDPGEGSVVLTANSTDGFFAKYSPAGKLIFVKRIAGKKDQVVRAIATDDSLNIYIAGVYNTDSTDMDPGAGKAFLPHDSDDDIFFGKYDINGNYVFGKAITGNVDDFVAAIILDKDRNILLTGTFNSHITDFDPGTAVKNVGYHGNNDAFVAKYDNQGNYLFAFSVGGKYDDIANAVTTDSAGNIFVTGLFNYTDVDFDPLPGDAHQALRSSNGLYDIFLAKYSPTAAFLFVNTIGGTGADIGNKIRMDAENNVLIMGTFTGAAVDFNSGAGVDTLSSTGLSRDLFFAKYDNSGNYKYAKQIAGLSDETTAALDLYNNGNILIAGYFSGSIDIDPGKKVKELSSEFSNSFLSVYTPAGNLLAGTAIDNYRSFVIKTNANRITHDRQRNIYVVGQFEGIVDFDPGPGTYYLTSASDAANFGNEEFFGDIFFAKYSPEGKLIFAKNISGPHAEIPNAITVDKDNNVYLCGLVGDSTDFDPGENTFLLGPSGNNDKISFFAKYDAKGDFVFAKGIQFNYYDQGILGIAVDSTKKIYVTGDFTGADFDPGPGIVQLKSAGSKDMFFAQYDSSGNYVYCKQIGQAGNSYGASGYDIQLSGKGNLIITGIVRASAADFDPGSGVHLINTGTLSNSNYIAGYTKTGAFLFASSSVNIDGFSNPVKLALDKNDNIYVTGYYKGKLDFDPGPDSAISPDRSAYKEMFFEKYDANGKYLFAKFIYGSANNHLYNDVTVNSIYADDYSNFYITGGFYDVVDFDPGPGKALIGTPKVDYSNGSIFLARYDSLGNYTYAYAFKELEGGGRHGFGEDLFVNNFGQVILAGSSANITNLGVGADSVIFYPTNFYDDFFIMQYLQPGFCAIADSLYATNITSNSTLLHWRYPHNSQGFTIQYRPVNTNTWQSTTSAGSTLSKKLNNLQANTKYEWRMSALCSNDTSNFSDKNNFTTKAAAALAFTQNDLNNTGNAILTIYPNPSKGRFTVSIKSGSISSLKIINSTGNVVYSNTNLTHNSVNVNLGHAASGTYLLSVSDGSKTFNKKLIIEK